MAISTNSIFHFTWQLETLKSILSDGGFKITYCLENYVIGESEFKGAIPMVTFCDIPLSSVAKHITNYGTFSLGLSKKWAFTNGLNPVLYMQDTSICSRMIEPHILNAIFNDEHKDINIRYIMTEKDEKVTIKDVYTGERKTRIDSIIGLLSFMKNHNGPLFRKGKLISENYKYYDEREWRFVPTYKIFHELSLTYYPFYFEEDYNEWRSKSEKKKFLPRMLLSFDSSNIDYIILESEEQKNEFIQFMRGLTHLYKSSGDFELLVSRLFSTEKINEDL